MPRTGGRHGGGGGGGGGRSGGGHARSHVRVTPTHHHKPVPVYRPPVHHHHYSRPVGAAVVGAAVGYSVGSSAAYSTPTYATATPVTYVSTPPSPSYETPAWLKCLMCVSALLCLVFFITGLSVGLSFAVSRRIEMAPLSTAQVTPNTVFNKGLRLYDNNYLSSLYLYNTLPPLDQSYQGFVNRTVSVFPDSFETWYWNLKPGSVINITLCNTKDIEFLYFIGESNYNAWVSDYYTASYNMRNYYSAGVCPSQSSPQTIGPITIDRTNNYYFVFSNPSITASSPVTVTFSLQWMEYDLSQGYVDMCKASPHCDLRLAHDSGQFALISTGNTSTMNIDDTIAVSWEPIGDVGFYFAAFGTIAIFFCLLPCVVYCCYKRSRSNSEYHTLPEVPPALAADSIPMATPLSPADPVYAQPVVGGGVGAPGMDGGMGGGMGMGGDMGGMGQPQQPVYAYSQPHPQMVAPGMPQHPQVGYAMPVEAAPPPYAPGTSGM